jgi:hypothetical protein
MIPPRISGLFTVSTRVGWVRQWYETLGWRSPREDDIFVSYPVGGMTFALWSLGSAAPNVAAVVAEENDFSGTLLCTVVDSPEELDATLDSVTHAGGRVIVPGHDVGFGRSGWFLDPVGTTWEIAWIDGCSSAMPFAGAPLPDALAANLVGALLSADDPLGLADFYSEGMGWADVRLDREGRPSFALDGGTLILSQSGTIPDSSSGPVPILGIERDGHGEHPATRLMRSGATSVPLDGRKCDDIWLADPFGLHWVLTDTI